LKLNMNYKKHLSVLAITRLSLKMVPFILLFYFFVMR